MTFKEAAKLILRESRKPLTAKQLEAEIKKRDLVDSRGKTQYLTIGAQIATDIKNKGELSDFKRVGPGKFILNETRSKLEAEIKPDRIIDELEHEEEKEVEGGYIGKAGEYAVLSELLFRGYNAALMAVDIGVDILATKGSETFHIQVKTRNISKRHDAFHFNLRIVSFERHNAGKTFYIFVLREN
ncbi:MAG: HTH domain-containing protein, partial [Patescibacteria group bacterium]